MTTRCALGGIKQVNFAADVGFFESLLLAVYFVNA